MTIALSRLIAAAEGTRLYSRAELNPQVYGLAFDSRRVQPGWVYFALRGTKTRGTNFLGEARAQGAVAAFVDEPPGSFADPGGMPLIEVVDARWALAACAAEFYGHPSRDLTLVGVTGTNGKTTVTSMLQRVFETAGFHSGLLGSVVYDLSDRQVGSHMTTPDAPDLQRMLREMVSDGATHCAMEVSSHSLAQSRVAFCHFRAAVFTNLTPDHMDFHGTLEKYVEAKERLFRDLPGNGKAIINGDDPFAQQFAAAANGEVVICSSGQGSADYCLAESRITPLGNRFTLSHEGNQVLFQTAVAGRHNLSNALLAAATAMELGVPVRSVQAGLAGFSGVFRRLELFYHGRFDIIDDYAHNPGSIKAAFDYLSERRAFYARVHVVNAIRGNRGLEVNRRNAEAIADGMKGQGAIRLWVTSSRDVTGPADHVTDQEQSVFSETLLANSVPFTFRETLRGALSEAVARAEAGDLVLLLGAQGMDPARDILGDMNTVPAPSHIAGV